MPGCVQQFSVPRRLHLRHTELYDLRDIRNRHSVRISPQALVVNRPPDSLCRLLGHQHCLPLPQSVDDPTRSAAKGRVN